MKEMDTTKARDREPAENTGPAQDPGPFDEGAPGGPFDRVGGRVDSDRGCE